MMRRCSNKLAYILLAIAMIGLPLQPLYAALSQHVCEHHSSTSTTTLDAAPCHQMSASKNCDKDGCGCTSCASSQINIASHTQFYTFSFLASNLLSEPASLYTQHFYNPLLRPPIH